MDKIDTYYSNVDKKILTNLCKNNNLKNLINLSTQTDINVFNKNKLKNKDKLIKECEQIKKKELKHTSTLLSNLAKLNQVNDIQNIHNVCQKLEDKITHIDKIIDCVKVLDTNNMSDQSPKSDIMTDYIECYSNC
jgi:hypothetical protein